MYQRHPPIQWSQRQNYVSISVELRDITEEVIDFSDGNTLKIQCKARDRQYSEEFELYAPINVEESSFKKTGFHLTIHLQKEAPDAWNRLHKSKAKFPNISVDWNNWVDLDSEEEEEAEEFDFAQQQAAGFGEGTPDSDDDEDEDDGLDDLEGDVDVETTLNKE